MKKEKSKLNFILKNAKQKSFIKKRKILNIKFKSFKLEKLLKTKGYIPYFLITSIILLSIILFIIFGPLLRVKNIEIIKKDNITNMNIAYKSVEDFRGKSIFKIDEKDLFQKFKNYQENIKIIDLNIIFPNTIRIEIGSHRELFNTLINDKSYILVENGTLIPSKPSKGLKTIEISKEIDKNEFIDYKKIFDPLYLYKINEIITKLEENLINLNIENIKYYEVERELHLNLKNKTKLIFSLDKNIEITQQIKKLVIFNKEHISIENSKIIYVDLRIKNKIFFCPIDNEYYCNKNIKSIYTK